MPPKKVVEPVREATPPVGEDDAAGKDSKKDTVNIEVCTHSPYRKLRSSSNVVGLQLTEKHSYAIGERRITAEYTDRRQCNAGNH